MEQDEQAWDGRTLWWESEKTSPRPEWRGPRSKEKNSESMNAMPKGSQAGGAA